MLSVESFAKFFVIGAVLPHLTTGVEEGFGYSESDPRNSLLSAQNVLLSLSVLCTVILVVLGCTWATWKRVFCFWREPEIHHEAPPDWFVPQGPTTGITVTSFSELDAGALPGSSRGRGSIAIDPLPTLNDLGIDGRDSFELRTFRTPAILPVASTYAEDMDIEDWFQEPQTSFPRDRLEYQKIVGKGWFGKVLETEATGIKQYVRVSNVVTRELRDNATESEQQRFLNEARIFREAQQNQGPGSEHVLKLLGFCVEQMPFILIFEYYPLGDLKTYLRGRARQTPSGLNATDDGILVRMIIDIIRGLKWIHQVGFVHGDLASRNCLVATPAGKVVIGDYGCSVQKHKLDYYWAAGHTIPIRWAAPETLDFDSNDSEPDGIKTHEVTPEANIWSLGVTIWEIFQLGKTPYDTLTDEDVIRRVIRQKSYVLEPPQLPFVNAMTKDKIYQMLVACWRSSPDHRPAIDTIEQIFITPA